MVPPSPGPTNRLSRRSVDETSWTAASLALGAVVAVLGAFFLAALAAAAVGRRTSLGLAHPIVLWLGLEALFFGPGSVALAVVDGRPGPALYLAGAVVATALGATASAWIANRRAQAAETPRPPLVEAGVGPPTPGRRTWLLGFLLAGLGLAAITPDLMAHGIPLLVTDITGARTELAGFGVQPLRVAWPALGVLLLFAATASGSAPPAAADPPTGADSLPPTASVAPATPPPPATPGAPAASMSAATPGAPAASLAPAPPSPAAPAPQPPSPRGEPVGRLGRLAAIVGLGAIVTVETLLAGRYLLAELGLALVLAWWLAARRLPRRALLALGVGGAVVFVGLGAIRIIGTVPGRELEVTVERTVSRLVLVQPRTLAALQEAIPAETDYFGGLTWLRRFGPLLGRDDIPNLGYWIYPRVVPGPQPLPGYAAPGLIGEAWANFGPAGLGLFVLFGVVAERLGALVARLGRQRRSIADLAAASLAVLFVARTHALGLNGLLVLLGLVAVWRLLVDRPRGLVGDVAAVLRWRA